MCGIVGYIGNKVVDKELVDILKNLEYRGYDSAGVAVYDNGNIVATKAEGKIANLEAILEGSKTASIGIAHTRWATHGKPTTTNAHPHMSDNKEWAVVHNGIIENFGELKREIEGNSSIKFVSETDTEVVAQLLQVLDNKNPIETLINTCSRLEGSFALGVINKKSSDTLYLAKRKSPLYVSKNDSEVFVASDPICFAGKTTEYYMLEDDEFCKASLDEFVFYNDKNEVINKLATPLNSFEANFGKQNYPHFMLKEIEEVPSVIGRIATTYTDSTAFEKISIDVLKDINKIILVGCGTAYHAGLMGASMIEKYARIESRTYVASEFRYSDPIIDNKTLAIFVSQSGETADTISAHDLAKSKGAKTIALTNVLYSALAKKSDYVLPVCAGPEIAVASTKAYTAQITILYMFARYLGNVKHNKDYDYMSDVLKLSKEMVIPSAESLEKVANDLVSQDKAFFIGRGVDYVSSEEASLKLKEITYINTQAYPSGELKHGFLALVETGTILFVIATQKDLLDKTLNGAHEAYARGARIVLVTPFDIPEDKLQDVYARIKVQDFGDDLMPIVSIGAFQMLSYLTSVKKGLNPDQPRNLAKSVTVE